MPKRDSIGYTAGMIHSTRHTTDLRFRVILLLAGAMIAGCGSGLVTEEDRTEAIVAKAKAELAADLAKKAAEAKSSDALENSVKYSDDAFRQAALDGRLETVRQAFASGSDVNASGPDGRVALQLAAFEGQSDVIEFLLAKGADVNHRDATGRTALMYASTGPFAESVKLLLAAGAEIDVVDNDEGFTALMFAAAEGQLDVVRLLMKAKADATIKDIDGDTAQSFAAKNGHAAVAELLESGLSQESELPENSEETK